MENFGQGMRVPLGIENPKTRWRQGGGRVRPGRLRSKLVGAGVDLRNRRWLTERDDAKKKQDESVVIAVV